MAATAIATEELVQALPKWKVEFIKELVCKGEFERGELKDFLDTFAHEWCMSVNTIKTFYYTALKKNTSPELELVKQMYETQIAIDDEKSNPEIYVSEAAEAGFKVSDVMSASDLQRLTTLNPAPAADEKMEIPVYKPGTMIDVEVVEVRPFGALVKTLDGYDTQGLVHISEMSDKFVSDVNKHFRFGDKLKARVVKFDKIKDQIGLSTKSLQLPEYGLKETPNAFKKAEMPVSSSIPPVSVEKLAEVKRKLEEEKKEVSATVTRLVTQDERSIIRELVGDSFNLTAKGETAFAEILAKFSGMRVGFALAQVLPNFDVDMGVLLAKEIEKKLGESL